MAPITINKNTIDPSKVEPEYLPKDASKTQFIILQCHHRLSPQEFAELAEKKVEVQRLVEETSYLCKYQPDDLAVLQQLSFVKQALVYHSDFVISASLKQENGVDDAKQLKPYTIVLHQGTSETGADLFKEIERFTEAQLIDSSAHQLRVRLPGSALSRIAKIDYVETIEETKVIEPRTVVATGVLRAGDALKPNPVFQGEGEIIAVADHGFDKGSKTDVHPAFLIKNTFSKDVSRVIDVVNAGRNTLFDEVGHGTHVAGCALGDLDDRKVGFGDTDPYNVNRIQAPAAKAQLYFQAIAPGENVIPDLDTLFETPAKIHNNSWGGRSVTRGQPQETYTQAESFPVDRAMWKDRELLVVWSAGNDGMTWTGAGPNPTYRQIGAETAAKNSIVVSSTFEGRHMVTGNTDVCMDGEENPTAGTIVPATVCDEGASKGPTTDLRLKPDVVAPGVGILSALSRSAKPNAAARKGGWGVCNNEKFCFMTGTSHAAPLVAGCAAALREALKKAHVANPSGALVKALLINGAVDLAGSAYNIKRPDNTSYSIVMPAAPNPIQGYGRVDLERSLRCVYPPTPGHGMALDVTGIAVGHPWNVTLDVPPTKPMLRVTLAYTDFPGNILQDDIVLSVSSKTAAGVVQQTRHADAPQSPPYEVAPPVYTASNVQKVTWACGQPKVSITVAINNLIPTSKEEFALCFFFNAN